MRLAQFGLALLLAVSAVAATPPRPYHLELEATPEAAFPWLGRVGKVEIHVYPQGVRSDALWLNAFSKNGSSAVTVANPLGRMYVDVTIAETHQEGVRLAVAGERCPPRERSSREAALRLRCLERLRADGLLPDAG